MNYEKGLVDTDLFAYNQGENFWLELSPTEKEWKLSMKRLRKENTIKTLGIMSNFQTTKKNWKEVSEIMTEKNKSVTKLAFQRGATNPDSLHNIMDFIENVLSKNMQITTLRLSGHAYDEFMAKQFLDMIANNTHLVTLDTTSIIFEARLDLFSQVLKNCQHLEELILRQETDPETYKIIINAIKTAPRIKKLNIMWLNQSANFFPFMELIATNKITRLTLWEPSASIMEPLFVELKNNAALKELIIYKPKFKANRFDPRKIGEALKQVQSLQTLHIIDLFSDYEGPEFIAEGLKECKSLRQLYCSMDWKATPKKLVEILSDIKSLKTLSVGDWDTDGFANMVDLIRQTRFITTLNMKYSEASDDMQNFQQICFAMMENRSIRYWTMETPGAYKVGERTKLLSQLMEANRTLIDVKLVNIQKKLETTQFMLEKGAEEQLAINKMEYEETRNRMWSFIKMFALRREKFLSILPLEIWIRILSFVEHSEDQYDQLFLASLACTMKPAIAKPVAVTTTSKKKKKSNK
jgi:hypothetical protein